MKKLFLVSTLILGIGIVPTLYSKENESIELTKKVGDVQTNTGSSWKKATTNSSFKKGDSLKTGLDSYAELALNKDNRFRLKEDSEVEMDKILEGNPNPSEGIIKLVQFNLKSGSMIAKLDKLPKGVKLSVGSPTAVAGATGTEFAVVVESEGQTHVAVLESTVQVVSTSNPNKSVSVAPFQKVDIAPWDVVMLQAKGTGILSKKILGDKFVQQAQGKIILVGVGIGQTEEQAHVEALRSLSDRVLDIELAPEYKIGDLLEENLSVSEKVYEALFTASPVKKERLPDGTFQEELEVSLIALQEALGQPIKSVSQTIRPINLAEYGRKFGPLARVTTRRAAQVDALRKLAQKIYGSVIDTQTTIKDFEATNDQITTVVQGVVQGGEILQETYFSDGSVSVRVQSSGKQIKGALTPIIGDVLGNNYMSSPTRIIVDDFETYKELENI